MTEKNNWKSDAKLKERSADLAGLEQLLLQRADTSAMPELAARVQAAVDSREAARLWLKQHPDYFRRKLREASQPSRPRQLDFARPSGDLAPSRQQLRAMLLSISASGSPRTWIVAGSLVLGAACGYLIGRDFSRGISWTGANLLGGLAVVSAGACGLMAAALSQWRSIRNYLA